MRKFFDRYAAGIALGREIAHLLPPDKNSIVLALPNGGIPVAYAVAKNLEVELDVITVRKLGIPGNSELAFGVIAPGGVRLTDPLMIHRYNLSTPVMKAVESQELVELQRHELLLRDHLPPPEVEERRVIIVDDGLATGLTMSAAVAWASRHGAGQIIAAAPIASIEACEKLTVDPKCALCACKRTPEPFGAVKDWYENFPPVSDAVASGIVQRARRERNASNERQRA